MIKRIFRGVAAVLICALALGALTSAMQLIGNGIAWSGKSDEPEKLSPSGGEMYMSKKKKFFSLNFFAKNHSKQSMGHPNFVFGRVGDKYKSFGLTHHPKENHPYVTLTENPNPNDKTNSYLQKQVLTTHKRFFEEKEKDWSFSSEDRAVVRHHIKKYKKRR